MQYTQFAVNEPGRPSHTLPDESAESDNHKMKAVVYQDYGPPEVLRVVEVDKPTPGDHEILVSTYASTASAASGWIRWGVYPGSVLFTIVIRLLYGIFRPRKKIPGFEFSGVVESVGKKVTRFKPGDAVYGTTNGSKNGAYAEYVSVPEQSKGVVNLKPEGLSFEEAAGLPVGGMTALQLVKRTGLRANERCLIYGASGSVGTYAVQMAKYFGGIVTGVCSTANVELVASLGADEVIDYTKVDIFKSNLKFEVVIDAVGKLSTSQIRSLCKESGRFASVKSSTEERVEYLDVLEQMISEDRLRVVIDRIYLLDNIIEAHRYLDLGRKRGNVIIRM